MPDILRDVPILYNFFAGVARYLYLFLSPILGWCGSFSFLHILKKFYLWIYTFFSSPILAWCRFVPKGCPKKNLPNFGYSPNLRTASPYETLDTLFWNFSLFSSWELKIRWVNHLAIIVLIPVEKFWIRGSDTSQRAGPPPLSFIHLNQIHSPYGLNANSHGCLPTKLNLISSVPQCWNAWRKGRGHRTHHALLHIMAYPQYPMANLPYILILFKFYGFMFSRTRLLWLKVFVVEMTADIKCLQKFVDKCWILYKRWVMHVHCPVLTFDFHEANTHKFELLLVTHFLNRYNKQNPTHATASI